MTWCADVVAAILDSLGIERAHLLGNSWGAMIGGTFAARHPDRICCAVLLNGTASAPPKRQRFEYGAMLTMARLLGGIRPPLTRSVVRAFLGPTSRRERPAAVKHVLATARGVDVRSVSYAIRSVVPLRPDQTRLFATIRTPVLVVAGREDPTFPVPEVQRMAEAYRARSYRSSTGRRTSSPSRFPTRSTRSSRTSSAASDRSSAWP